MTHQASSRAHWRPFQQFSRSIRRRWQSWGLPIVYKLAISLALVVIAGMGVLGAAVVSIQSELMLRQINDFGSTIVTQYAASATELVFTEDELGLQVLTTNLVNDPRVYGAAIYAKVAPRTEMESTNPASEGEKGEVETASDDLQERLLVQVGQQPFTEETGQSLSRSGPQWLTFTAPISFKGVDAGRAMVTLSGATVSQGFRQTINTLVLMTGVIMLASLAIAYGMSRRLAHPIKRLVDATDELAEGNFDVRLEEQRRDELGQLIVAVNHMATSLREKQQMEGVLSSVVADDVAEHMLSRLDSVGVGSEQVEASVLFVDIVGFTALAENASHEVVVDLLNEYFTYFTRCSRLFFGTVDKFIGDCAMVIFGAPKADPDHRYHAVACAVVMQRLVQRLNRDRQDKGMPQVEVRIGINSGEMMAGLMGSEDRMEYTVVGDAVNLASRLSNLANAGEVLIGEAVYGVDAHGHATANSLRDRIKVSPFSQMTVKGKTEAVATYRVKGVMREQQHKMDIIIDDLLEKGLDR